ncbi:MAG: SDR family oxidoreductase [Bacteroidota bacterium]|jgi:NAD(P)-dependent dehydrogenase (short-subunit alcohol dehydrogenase family)
MENQFSLQGKNILISGASSGIGRCVAVFCSRAGANVLMLGRDESTLNETLEMLKPARHALAVIDLNNFSSYTDVIAPFVENNGKIYGIVHSAGLEFSGPYNLTKPQNFQNIFNINAVAGFELARIVASKFADSEAGGSYVFISSIRALFGVEFATAYSASKGAVIAASRSLSLELAKKHIRVNTISPSLVLTPLLEKYFESLHEDTIRKMKEQHPLGFGMPEDVANACIYLLSDASRWMTGNNIILDGGYSVR